MSSKIVLVTLFCVLTFVNVNSTLEIRLPVVPNFSNFVNRITNTTFGFVRGGISLFGRTIDRIINSFSRVEDRLRQLLEEFRKVIVRGIPEFNIPVLDPLHIDRIQFNVLHEAADINGSATDVTIRHISKFLVEHERFSDLGQWTFQLDLNLSFPFIRVEGMYDVNAVIGDTFGLFGNGKFWLNLYNLKLDLTAVIRFELTRLRMTDLKIFIKLKKLENNFENLMHNNETGAIYNKVISRLAPEAIDMLWPELQEPVQKEVMNYINAILENTTVANIARRIFNIIP